jgi:hypothetical protein
MNRGSRFKGAVVQREAAGAGAQIMQAQNASFGVISPFREVT